MVLSVALTGCAQQSFTIRHDLSENPQLETSQTFFLHGIGQTKTIDASKVCGSADKVVRTEVKQSGVDVLLQVITLGIYTPHHASVYCSN